MAPSFFSAALATYPPLRGSGFHYVLELWPVLAVVTLLTLASLIRTQPHARWGSTWAILGLLLMDQDPIAQLKEYSMESYERRDVISSFSFIPSTASVSADEMSGPWLAGRSSVTRWPDMAPFGNQCPDWLVLQNKPIPSDLQNRCSPQVKWKSGDWVGYQSNKK